MGAAPVLGSDGPAQDSDDDWDMGSLVSDAASEGYVDLELFDVDKVPDAQFG